MDGGGGGGGEKAGISNTQPAFFKIKTLLNFRNLRQKIPKLVLFFRYLLLFGKNFSPFLRTSRLFYISNLGISCTC